MKHRTHIWLIPVAALGLVCVLSCSKTDKVADPGKPGGSGTEVIGKLVDTANSPVYLARVILYKAAPADSILDTVANYLTAVQTDTKGNYRFDTVHAGAYEVRAAYDNGALVMVRGGISYTDTTKALDLGTDTMRAPGSIHGCAALQQADRSDIMVYVPGTSFIAITDSNGCFTMTGVPPGMYDLAYTHDGYLKAYAYDQVVYSRTTSEAPAVDMEIDPAADVPIPQGLVASFDTLEGLVFLAWDPVIVSDLAGYLVWVDTSASPGQVFSAGPSSSAAVYLDTVGGLLAGKIRDTIRYQITAVDRDNIRSNYSSAVSVVIACDSLVRTALAISPLPDTILVGDTLGIVLHYVNPTRRNSTIAWWEQSGADWISLRQTTADSSSGWDTLKYVPADSGAATIRIEATDDYGSVWRTSMSFGVLISSYTPNTWETLAPMKMARRYLGTAILNDTIYAAGGVYDYIPPTGTTAQQIPEDTVEAFDPKTGQWSVMPSMLMERSEFGLAAVDGKLYAMGGHTKVVRGPRTSIVVTDSIEVYDPATRIWAAAGIMTSPRYSFAATAWNGKIYVAGGVKGPMEDTISSDIEMYDPANGTWSTIGHLNTPRYCHAAACMDGKLYVYGGMGAEQNALADAEVVDLSTGISTPLSPMAGSRVNLGAATVQDGILIMGGSIDYASNWSLNPAIETYYPQLSQWSSTARLPMQPPVQCFGAVAYKGSVYVIGGTTQQAAVGYMGQTNAVYKYNP